MHSKGLPPSSFFTTHLLCACAARLFLLHSSTSPLQDTEPPPPPAGENISALAAALLSPLAGPERLLEVVGKFHERLSIGALTWGQSCPPSPFASIDLTYPPPHACLRKSTIDQSKTRPLTP